MKFENPITVSICVLSTEQLTAVYALLGGASLAAVSVSTGNVGGGSVASQTRQPETDAPKPQGTATVSSGADNAPAGAPVDSGEVDTGGHPWSADLHASTKTKTKDGYWRMKVGTSRPADLPGFPKDAGAASTGTTGTQSNGPVSQAGEAATGPIAGPATSEDPDDEFAAFRNAAEKANTTDANAAASVPARKWSDSDLGALCNQAAVKLGDPAPVKELIAKFMPEGAVAHSRNVPEDQREAFAQAVEQRAGITFAG